MGIKLCLMMSWCVLQVNYSSFNPKLKVKGGEKTMRQIKSKQAVVVSKQAMCSTKGPCMGHCPARAGTK